MENDAQPPSHQISSRRPGERRVLFLSSRPLVHHMQCNEELQIRRGHQTRHSSRCRSPPTPRSPALLRFHRFPAPKLRCTRTALRRSRGGGIGSRQGWPSASVSPARRTAPNWALFFHADAGKLARSFSFVAGWSNFLGFGTVGKTEEGSSSFGLVCPIAQGLRSTLN